VCSSAGRTCLETECVRRHARFRSFFLPGQN
jgi:hypothetical protein